MLILLFQVHWFLSQTNILLGLAHDIMTQVKDEFKTPRILTFAISNPASSDTEVYILQYI